MLEKISHSLRSPAMLLGIALSLVFGSVLQPTFADENKLSDAEVERIKLEVMRELRESDFLQKEIELGIQAFIRKQREQQAAAQAAQQRQQAERAKNVRRVNAERDHIFGNPDAVISIIEYSDFECPYCQAFHTTPKELVELYGDRVNWVYRHYPLPFHNPVAQDAAEASECVTELGGNEAFWYFTDALYARGPVGDETQSRVDKMTLVQELDLDEEAFAECLDSNRYQARVEEDLREGAQIGINGTPGTVILNRESGEVRLISGAQPPRVLAAAIEEIIN
jgi:protein-disulfide isomerase